MVLYVFRGLMINMAVMLISGSSADQPFSFKIAFEKKSDPKAFATGNPRLEELVSFAESLIGTRYKYASADPTKGFDCSGFITYVFKHYDISVPRSSVNFTSIGKRINLKDARRGDLILFTGTNSKVRVVGHIGIITSKPNEKTFFIHSTSGKVYGVIVTSLNKHYQSRFVKVIRVFE